MMASARPDSRRRIYGRLTHHPSIIGASSIHVKHGPDARAGYGGIVINDYIPRKSEIDGSSEIAPDGAKVVEFAL